MKPAIAVLLVLALASCGRTPASATYGSDGVTIEIEFVNGEVLPLNEFIDVKIGEPVRLHVISDVDEKIHVHSDPAHTFDIAAGDNKTFTFTIETPSDVAVDAHVLKVTIAQLVAGP